MFDLLSEIMGGLDEGKAVGAEDMPEFAVRFGTGENLQGTIPGHIAVGKRAGLDEKIAMRFIVGEKKFGTGVGFG